MSAKSVRRNGGIDPATVSWYDLLLAALPLPLVAGVAWSLLTSAPTALGVGLGSLPSAAVLCYGLFYDAPAGGTARRSTSADRRRERAIETE
ncbi:hypothetical protein [Halegenticoccus tardaugens]|uniref:hypothetical protein n=1 Tax=Halegenticoccus tardaugens TaxID=2071624 RepID=UPI00100A6F76|nr:hypothetical protein [Halegenticoccus tardaugens]